MLASVHGYRMKVSGQERAIERGELPPDTDTGALVAFMSAPLITRIVDQSGLGARS